MSNAIDQNPFILDTGGSSAVVSSMVAITNIRWVDYNNDIADGDQVVLKDVAGKVIFEARITGTGAGVPIGGGGPVDFIDFIVPFKAKGLILTTLTHGKLYVYCTQDGSTAIPASA
jgi:hypothetical protein